MWILPSSNISFDALARLPNAAPTRTNLPHPLLQDQLWEEDRKVWNLLKCDILLINWTKLPILGVGRLRFVGHLKRWQTSDFRFVSLWQKWCIHRFACRCKMRRWAICVPALFFFWTLLHHFLSTQPKFRLIDMKLYGSLKMDEVSMKYKNFLKLKL